MDAIFAVSLTHKSENSYRRARQDLAKAEFSRVYGYHFRDNVKSCFENLFV